MFKKAQRLNSSLFSKFYKQGKRINNPYTTTIFTPNDQFLCAVVVGKKVYKKAYDRNRLKRRIYEVVRRLKTGETTGVYIVIAKPNIKNLTKRELLAVLEQEIGLILK